MRAASMKSTLIEVDLVQAEWVVTAYLAQDARMLDIIKSGKDPHTETGHLISGAPPNFIDYESELVGHESDPDVISKHRENIVPCAYFLPRTMSIRQAGKKSNHGLNYNMGYRRFALENELPEGDAKRIVDAYHSAYPGIRKRFHRMVELQLREHQYLVNCFGQKGVFIGEIDVALLDAAYSFYPQSTVADITNKGMVSIHKTTVGPLHAVQLLLNGHDSLLLQALVLDHHDLYVKMVEVDKAMTTPATYHGHTFTIARSYKIGQTWGSMAEVQLNKDAVGEAWSVGAAAA